MPTVNAYLNTRQITQLDKICRERKCKRYDLTKLAMVEFLEKEEEKKHVAREEALGRSEGASGQPGDREQSIKNDID